MIQYARYTMRSARCLVVLDTMWGAGGAADRWFTINPQNHSGRRLYRLTGLRLGQLWVTNACPQQTNHAMRHGTPDACWLYDNLKMLPVPARRLPLLVCGRVANQTMEEMVEDIGLSFYRGPIIEMMHPAARSWTRKLLTRWERKLTTLIQEN